MAPLFLLLQIAPLDDGLWPPTTTSGLLLLNSISQLVVSSGTCRIRTSRSSSHTSVTGLWMDPPRLHKPQTTRGESRGLSRTFTVPGHALASKNGTLPKSLVDVPVKYKDGLSVMVVLLITSKPCYIGVVMPPSRAPDSERAIHIASNSHVARRGPIRREESRGLLPQ